MDLGKWEKKALKRLKDKGSAACDFESVHIPADEARTIKAVLARCTTVEEVRAAFKANTRLVPRGASDPVLEVPDEVTFSEAEIDASIAVWDRVMGAEYAGMLDAETVE